MKKGEIWICKDDDREVEIDSIKYTELVSFTSDEVENMSPQEMIDVMASKTFKDEVVECHWVDTLERLPIQIRSTFIKEFRRK